MLRSAEASLPCAFFKAWTAAGSSVLGFAKMSLGLSTASPGFSVVGFSSAMEPSAMELGFSSAMGPSAMETSTGESFFVPAAFARPIGQTEGPETPSFQS